MKTRKLEFDLPSKKGKPFTSSMNPRSKLSGSVFERPTKQFGKLEHDDNDDQKVISMLIAGAIAKTDDDIKTNDYNPNDELGGLTNIDVMNDLIKEFKTQTEEFIIEITESQDQFFSYKYNDPIFTLTEPNTQT
jgi:hypothetical protein